MRLSGPCPTLQGKHALLFNHAVSARLARGHRLLVQAQQDTAIERAGGGFLAQLIELQSAGLTAGRAPDPNKGSLANIVRQTVTSPVSAAYPAALALAGYFLGYGEQGAVLGARLPSQTPWLAFPPRRPTA